MVSITAAGDSFTMGDGVWGPKAVVGFEGDFLLSMTEITNGQFVLFMDDGGYSERGYWTANGWKWKGKTAAPAFWKDAKFSAADRPVVGVSWYEAAAFCNWLSAREGLDSAYDDAGRVDLGASGYRLPTEAEWEYAAAKGAPDRPERVFPWGDAWDAKAAVCRAAPSKASATAAVGSASPGGDTPDGIADMAGNVWEWCSDNSRPDDAVASGTCAEAYFFKREATWDYMVLRGAAWCNDFQAGFRAAYRNFAGVPKLRQNCVGFRVARSG